VQYGVAAASLLSALLSGVALRPALRSLVAPAGSPLGAPARQAVAAVLDSVDAAVLDQAGGGCARAATLHRNAVQRLGSACELPGMFLSSVHGMALAAACMPAGRPPDLAAAVRATILAGGDQASRSLFIGAALAAAGGSVPAVWRAHASSAEVREGIALAQAALAS
jgi:hypothetical protein